MAGVSSEEASAQLRRLEAAAHLLPALLHVLDVREVFDRLSMIAKRALPHDVLQLRIFSEDLKSLTTYASSDGGSDVGVTVPQAYPASVTRSWHFDIVDDLSTHAIEQHLVAATSGARSTLRIPIWFGNRVIGGVVFLSLKPDRYTTADVVIGRRLADYVAVGLSHHKLAEESRQAAALRERATNLEMLDGLLNTLTGVLDIRDVFTRVSEIAHRVLPHDGLSIAEMLPDGVTSRIHASHGLGELPYPFDVRIPDPTMAEDNWDYRLVDDLEALPTHATTAGARAGMRSAMYVSIRFAGRMFGGLNFYSKTPSRYVQDDVLVARRITDHVALALSHRRLAEQARYNDELRAKAERNDLLDELLATLTDTGELSEVFGRISAIARKVLPHDALLLPVFLPDGIHARRYVSSGVDPTLLPDVIEIPEHLRGSDWDSHVADDILAVRTMARKRWSDSGSARRCEFPSGSADGPSQRWHSCPLDCRHSRTNTCRSPGGLPIGSHSVSLASAGSKLPVAPMRPPSARPASRCACARSPRSSTREPDIAVSLANRPSGGRY